MTTTDFYLGVSPSKAYQGDPSGIVFRAQLDSLLKHWGIAGIKVEVKKLDSTFPTDRHPRYLLGMERGLHFDWGFDIDTKDKKTTNHVEWIGKAALQPLLKRFT